MFFLYFMLLKHQNKIKLLVNLMKKLKAPPSKKRPPLESPHPKMLKIQKAPGEFLEEIRYWKMKIYWNLYWNSSIWKNSLEFQDLVLENLELSDIAIKN